MDKIEEEGKRIVWKGEVRCVFIHTCDIEGISKCCIQM